MYNFLSCISLTVLEYSSKPPAITHVTVPYLLYVLSQLRHPPRARGIVYVMVCVLHIPHGGYTLKVKYDIKRWGMIKDPSSSRTVVKSSSVRDNCWMCTQSQRTPCAIYARSQTHNPRPLIDLPAEIEASKYRQVDVYIVNNSRSVRIGCVEMNNGATHRQQRSQKCFRSRLWTSRLRV